MANNMLLDDTRTLRREQRETRIARKRERREARALKHQHHTIGLETLAIETIDIAPNAPQVEEPAAAAETVAPTPARPPVTTAAETSASQQPTPSPVAQDDAPPASTPRAAQGESRRAARRQRDIAEFLERRDGKLSLAREEAKERIARLGEEETVHDALMALAHPEASPWQQHRERLCQAIATRRIPEIGAAARRACRGAAADGREHRTGRRTRTPHWRSPSPPRPSPGRRGRRSAASAPSAARPPARYSRQFSRSTPTRQPSKHAERWHTRRTAPPRSSPSDNTGGRPRPAGNEPTPTEGESMQHDTQTEAIAIAAVALAANLPDPRSRRSSCPRRARRADRHRRRADPPATARADTRARRELELPRRGHRCGPYLTALLASLTQALGRTPSTVSELGTTAVTVAVLVGSLKARRR